MQDPLWRLSQWVPHKLHQHGEQHIQHIVKHIIDEHVQNTARQIQHTVICMTTPSTVNSSIAQHCLMIKLIHLIHQCTSTPVKSVRNKSEKIVSKPANKLTTIIVNTQSIKIKNEMIWKVIDTRKPDIIVVSETWTLLEGEEVCLIRIKEQVGEKRSTVCTHLLKNTFIKHNKYVVNQTKHKHVDDISFRELFGRISGFIFKIRSDLSLPNTRSLYLRWPFFYETKLDQLP